MSRLRRPPATKPTQPSCIWICTGTDPLDGIDGDTCSTKTYCCPGCGTQLEVEAVPRGTPPDFEFLPDLDTYYRDWLGKHLPDKVAFEDKTLDAMRGWSA